MPTITITDSGPQVSQALYSSNAVYAVVQAQPTGTISASVEQLGQRLNAGTYFIWRRAVLFDTTGLQALGAITINSATLQLYATDATGIVTDFTVIITNDGTQVVPHNPVVKGDYEITQYTGGTGGAKLASTFVLGAYNDIVMNTAYVINDGINFTKVFLASNRDINAWAPVGDEYLGIGTENTVPVAQPMKLVIDYSLPSTGVHAGGGKGYSVSPEEMMQLDAQYKGFIESQNRPILLPWGYIEQGDSSEELNLLTEEPKKKKKKKDKWRRVQYTDVR